MSGSPRWSFSEGCALPFCAFLRRIPRRTCKHALPPNGGTKRQSWSPNADPRGTDVCVFCREPAVLFYPAFLRHSPLGRDLLPESATDNHILARRASVPLGGTTSRCYPA